jgi:hypothetical protein
MLENAFASAGRPEKKLYNTNTITIHSFTATKGDIPPYMKENKNRYVKLYPKPPNNFP